MAAPNRQDTRIARLDTPLATDSLVLSRFDGSEALSDLFEFTVEALANKTESMVDFDSMIGRHSTITFKTIDNRKRYFDGIVTEAEWAGVRNDQFVYRFVLRPWLWCTSFRTDCFIFHEKTAVQIIKEVFARHPGLADFTADELSKSYPQIEYVVQYRESDMDFVRRLMEQHGIGFYFRHSDGAHKLVLSDAYTSYDTIPGGSRKYIPLGDQHRREVEHFHSWTPERRFTSGKVMLRDYNFKTPSANMTGEHTGDAGFENGSLEVYDYPGRYMEQGHGTDYARVMLDRKRAEDGRFRAAGDCVSASPGSLMTLSDHFMSDMNREYLTLRCYHSYTAEDYRSSSSGFEGPPYEGSYEFMWCDKPYAPPAVTEKPCVQGPQTAKVVGDGEIDVDEHGRILVQFHWDRQGDQSMRVRLAQVWSGKNWGGMYIPRIGMEVIVQNLEGDPDMPVVIGTVYNGENKPPYPLPGKKNIAGLKSNSTPGGGGYNEYVFDDTKGNELIRQHGQYNLESVVENDEDWHIKHDRKTKIDNEEKREVGVNRTTKIGTNDTLNVGSTLTITARDKVYIEVGGAGGSKITMTPGSIKIESKLIEIEAAAQFKSTALLSDHSASTLMDIKGLLVKINS